MHREYHNITSYFNGYFNANERVKAGVEKITTAYKEDYDQLLPVFIIGDTASARSAYPDMEKAIEKCEKVISKHTITNDSRKDKKKPKLNKWIDDNYMTLGQAHYWKRNYYRSEELFNYVNRKFKEKDEQIFSASWAARSAMERGEYSKALQALSKIEAEDDMDEDLKANYFLVYADLHIRQGKLKEAAEKLELAIRFTKRKKNRARPNFILAQIYQQLERSNEAVERYEMVLRSRPNYELAFYAQINKALAFSRRGGSSDGIKKELEKMIRDEKNKDYLDQIYFALGDIYLEEQKRPEAVAYFEKSLRVTKADNKKQKSKTFLRLADLYFDQRKYADAQLYYDSTYKNLNPEHIRFNEVRARAESLGELVGYLNKINLNDSLTQICALKGDALEKKLKDIQSLLAKEAEEQRRRDEEAAAALADQQAQTPGATGPAAAGAYWIYNPAIRDKGYNDFKDYWGDRPLKDNWRLASKVSTLFDSPDESIIVGDSTDTASSSSSEDRYRVPDIEELRASLPCGDDVKMKETSAGVAEAYYQAGLIYKEKLDDEDNAIGSWQQLISNIDTSSFHPVAFYQLFRTWLSKESAPGYKANPFCSDCSSAYWADEIRSRYPGSEWSRLVDNPEYIDQADMKRTEENAAYEATYQMYVSRRYVDAISACSQVIDNEPGNQFLCKYRLLRAVCIGYTDAAYSIKENYFKELQEVKKTCAGSEEAKRADDLIKAGNQEAPGTGSMDKPGNTLPENGGNSQSVTNPTTAPNGGTTNGNSSANSPSVEYKSDLTVEHYMVTLLPVQGSDVNKVKAALSDFNASFYASAAMKVTNNLLGQQYHIVLVKPFKSATEAKEYLSTVKSNQEELKDVNSSNNKLFLISKPNYITLFKSRDVDAYLQFYQANYP